MTYDNAQLGSENTEQNFGTIYRTDCYEVDKNSCKMETRDDVGCKRNITSKSSGSCFTTYETQCTLHHQLDYTGAFRFLEDKIFFIHACRKDAFRFCLGKIFLQFILYYHWSEICEDLHSTVCSIAYETKFEKSCEEVLDRICVHREEVQNS